MKLFPILFDYKVKEEIVAMRGDGCTCLVIGLPWAFVNSHEKQALKNHSQTVQRLAERGGLSADEACAVLEDREWTKMFPAMAHARLKLLVSEWTDGTRN